MHLVDLLIRSRRARRRPPRSHRSSVTLAAVAGALLTTCLPVGSTSAAAQVPSGDPFVLIPSSGAFASVVRLGAPTLRAAVFPSARSFTGNFDDDRLDEVFLYNPGHGRDGILDVGDGDDLSLRDQFVGGDYQVVVGDFAPPWYVDDIIWYAPGPAQDHLWTFEGDGSSTSTPLRIDGRYRPVVGSFTSNRWDGRQNIIWYAPGPAADHLWTFGDRGGHATRPLRIDGDYRPLVGDFLPASKGRDQVVWWNPNGADRFASFTDDGREISNPLGEIGRYADVAVGRFGKGAGTDRLFLYNPGGLVDRFVRLSPSRQLVDLIGGEVRGSYQLAVGDIDQDGYDDIIWADRGTAILWFEPTGNRQSWVKTTTGPSRVHTL